MRAGLECPGGSGVASPEISSGIMDVSSRDSGAMVPGVGNEMGWIHALSQDGTT